MDPDLEDLLVKWPLSVLRDVDVAVAISGSASRCYALINKALKKGTLIRLRRGVYLIGKPYKKTSPSNFEIAHTLYAPSYVSFESALFYHHWIPEAVYTTTCATAKRTVEFNTPLGVFQYRHVPSQLCYLGVERRGEDEPFFIADPWKALADHYYVFNRNWSRPEDLYLDMRIEMESLLESDLTMLHNLSEQYQSKRVRVFLSKIFKDLRDGNKNY